MKIVVTKIVQAVDPTEKKINDLYKIADRASDVRSSLWTLYGSISGLLTLRSPRAVRDVWVKTGQGQATGLQARQWKTAMDEAFSTIKSLWSNAKTKVRKTLSKTKGFTEEEKHYAFY